MIRILQRVNRSHPQPFLSREPNVRESALLEISHVLCCDNTKILNVK